METEYQYCEFCRVEKICAFVPGQDPTKGSYVCLDCVLKAVSKHKMSDFVKERQRRSFAYGNTKIGNEEVTREVVDDAAESLKRGD